MSGKRGFPEVGKRSLFKPTKKPLKSKAALKPGEQKLLKSDFS